jgi:hypothetical protein
MIPWDDIDRVKIIKGWHILGLGKIPELVASRTQDITVIELNPVRKVSELGTILDGRGFRVEIG